MKEILFYAPGTQGEHNISLFYFAFIYTDKSNLFIRANNMLKQILVSTKQIN